MWAPPDWAVQAFPQKKSCLPAEGGFLAPLLENYRHLVTWLWVFGIEINWNQFYCSHWVVKSPFMQLTAVPSHLLSYLFIDFMLKTSQLQKKFFSGKSAVLSGKIGVLLLWICAVEEGEVNITFVRTAIEPRERKSTHMMLSQKGYFKGSFCETTALFKLKGHFSTSFWDYFILLTFFCFSFFFFREIVSFQKSCLFWCQSQHRGISEMKHLCHWSGIQTECFDVIFPVLFKFYFATIFFLVPRDVLPSLGKGWSTSGKDDKQNSFLKETETKEYSEKQILLPWLVLEGSSWLNGL